MTSRHHTLCNHSNSWGPMLVDYQNLAGSCGSNFVENCLYYYNTRQFITLLNAHGDVNSLKGKPTKSTNIKPHEQ